MAEQPGNIVFSIDPQVLGGLVVLGFVGLIFFILMLPAQTSEDAPLERLKRNFGFEDFNSGLLLIALLIWGAVFLLLGVGLIWLIWDLIWAAVPGNKDDTWDLRFELVKLAAMTATLGAVVALPITMQRLRLTGQQTNLTAEALLNDKINAAADDLHARRLVTMNPHKTDFRWDYWQDDIVRRNAAIDRLEGLAIERPEITARIARMLSIYVRELTSEHPPQKPPDAATAQELGDWAFGLTACRSDMENAVQVLGRLQRIDGVDAEKVKIDLRGANLQGFDLYFAWFEKARLTRAQMQGADLNVAQMQGADLSEAQMQRADLIGAQMQWAGLIGAQMQGADLSEAQMQGASLSWAEMQGAELRETEMDSATDLTATAFAQVAVRSVDYTDVALNQAQVDGMFYDGSVRFAPDIKRAPGREAVLGLRDFTEQWRVWQKERGFDGG